MARMVLATVDVVQGDWTGGTKPPKRLFMNGPILIEHRRQRIDRATFPAITGALRP